jgi:aspartate kinase
MGALPGSRQVDRVLVLKFGGTSVADAAAIGRVARIVRAASGGARPVVVTSALGGVTDGLLAAVRTASAGDADAALRVAEGLLERHRAAARPLLGEDGLADLAARLDDAAARLAELFRVIRDHPGTRRALQDEVVSYGERLSSRLLALALREAGLPATRIDARTCIRTDEAYTRAEPLREATEACTRDVLLPELEAGHIPVLGGFIGSTLEGATTTIGRGGSDHSAALVGAALGAAEIQIWTDVNGFLTADPRLVPAARPIAHLSYAEAAELAYFGAKVLHPRTIQPAVEREIPVRICNSYEPDAPGTVIDARREVSPEGIKAIAHKRGVTVVRITSARMLGAYGFLRAIFEVFDRHRTPVDIVATSEVSVSLTVDDPTPLPAIAAELARLGDVLVEEDCAIICVVGEGLRGRPGVAGRVFGALGEINIALISQGASSTNLTFAVAGADAAEAVTRLHAAFFDA